MGDTSVSKVTVGKTGFIQQVNQYFDAITVNFHPRTAAGAVMDIVGTLGDSTRRWANLFTKVITLQGDTSTLELSEDSGAISVSVDSTKVMQITETMVTLPVRSSVTDAAVTANGEYISDTIVVGVSSQIDRTITTLGGLLFVRWGFMASSGSYGPTILVNGVNLATSTDTNGGAHIKVGAGVQTVTFQNSGFLSSTPSASISAYEII